MKYGLFILVHHNSWLINTSLISLLLQTRQDYDLHFVYIRGDGEQKNKQSYKGFIKLLIRKIKQYSTYPDDIAILNFIKIQNLIILSMR